MTQNKCCVPGCRNTKKLCLFPRIEELQTLWCINIGKFELIQKFNRKSHYVCIAHSEDRVRNAPTQKKLLVHWNTYPTLNLPGKFYHPGDPILKNLHLTFNEDSREELNIIDELDVPSCSEVNTISSSSPQDYLPKSPKSRRAIKRLKASMDYYKRKVEEFKKLSDYPQAFRRALWAKC